MTTLRKLGWVIIALGLTGVAVGACITDKVNDRMNECEKAWSDYVAGPPEMTQPEILTEDWCFDHLTKGEP